MHRIRLALLALALGMLLAGPAAAASRSSKSAGLSGNLLQNPGFEEGLPGHPWMPAGWDTTISGLPSVFFGRDTVLAHGHGYAVSVVNVSTVVPISHSWVQTMLVPPAWWNKDLVFSIWTRSNGLNGRAYVRVVAFRDTISKMAKVWNVSHTEAQNRLHLQGFNDPQLEIGWAVRNFSDGETDWVRREVRLHVAPTTNYLQVAAGLVGTGQILFDDASLTLEPLRPDPPLALHTNLLADPGFEGNLDDWEISQAPYEGFRVVHDSTEAHGGRFSMRYEGGTGGMFKMNSGMCQAFTSRRLAGMHVKLSGWIKADSLGDDAYVMLFMKTLHGSERTLPVAVTGTSPWKATSIDMDVPPDTYEVWVWAVLQSPASGRVWFDDLRFEVTGPAETATPPASGKTATARRSKS